MRVPGGARRAAAAVEECQAARLAWEERLQALCGALGAAQAAQAAARSPVRRMATPRSAARGGTHGGGAFEQGMPVGRRAPL